MKHCVLLRSLSIRAIKINIKNEFLYPELSLRCYLQIVNGYFETLITLTHAIEQSDHNNIRYKKHIVSLKF